MPNEALNYLLQTHRISFALTDMNFVVQQAHDPTHLWGPEVRLGCSLFDLAPELEGQEDVLLAVLTAKLPSFNLLWVNRQEPDGIVRYLNLLNHQRRNGSGAIAGLVHVAEDVTELGELQQKLMQQRNELRLAQDELARTNLALTAANAELQRLDAAKSMFVSIAAHELRTPLASISGYADVLLEGVAGPLSDQQRGFVQIVQQGADRLLRITNDLLDLARIESGRLELILQPVHLPTLVRAVVQELQPQLQAKRLIITVEAADELPLGLVDEVRCQQIVANLLSNAIKYTPIQGTISLHLGLATEPGYVQLAVADSGVGIAAEDQARIFERFFRTEAGRLIDASGAGLGLHITRSLVELHGGRIWLTSDVGKGATVWVTLPAITTGTQEMP